MLELDPKYVRIRNMSLLSTTDLFFLKKNPHSGYCRKITVRRQYNTHILIKIRLVLINFRESLTEKFLDH